MKNKYILGLCSAAALALATSAYATPNQDAIRISIDNGATWLAPVMDTDGDGVISTTFTGNGFTLTVVASQTYPFIGSQASPQLDLAVLGKSGVGTVVIEFSAMDFTPVPTGPFRTDVTGTLFAGVTQTETTRIGAANALFAPGTAPGATFATIGPLSGTAGGTSFGVAPGQPNPYSITIQQVLTGTAAGQNISTDISLHVPDGGNTLMLLGSALSVLGLGVFRKSRKA